MDLSDGFAAGSSIRGPAPHGAQPADLDLTFSSLRASLPPLRFCWIPLKSIYSPEDTLYNVQSVPYEETL